MHAFLLTGSTSVDHVTEIDRILSAEHISIFDRVLITPDSDEEHIGIAQIREFNGRLQLAPHQSSFVAGVIQNAHLLTVESQNALLKLLEEPPPHVKLYIETELDDSLLPTIRSRCQIIYIEKKESDPGDLIVPVETIQALLTGSPGSILVQIAQIAEDRIKTKVWISEVQKTLHAQLLESLSGKTTVLSQEQCTRTSRLLQNAQRELSVNVNPKLVLDSVFLSRYI